MKFNVVCGQVSKTVEATSAQNAANKVLGFNHARVNETPNIDETGRVWTGRISTGLRVEITEVN